MMARYDFVCERCQATTEAVFRMGSAPRAVECPRCGGEAVRAVSVPRVSARNTGSPERRERFALEERMSRVTSQTPNAAAGVPLSEGVVKMGKRPRAKRRIRVTVP